MVDEREGDGDRGRERRDQGVVVVEGSVACGNDFWICHWGKEGGSVVCGEFVGAEGNKVLSFVVFVESE